MTDSNKGIGEMIKLGLILVCYAVAACTVLALVYNLTADRIKQNQNNAGSKAMAEVFSNADSFTSVTDFEPSENGAVTLSDFYIAKQGENVVGAVVQVTGPTYDKTRLVVGVDTNGIVTGMKILETSDSPGFGLKAGDPNYTLANGKTFYGQFAGKDTKEGFITNQTFDGITGATITSDAIGVLLTEGTDCINKYLEAY